MSVYPDIFPDQEPTFVSCDLIFVFSSNLYTALRHSTLSNFVPNQSVVLMSGLHCLRVCTALLGYLSSIITFTQSFVYTIIMIICYRVYNRKTQPGPNCLWVVCRITPPTSHYESTLKFMEKLKRLL